MSDIIERKVKEPSHMAVYGTADEQWGDTVVVQLRWVLNDHPCSMKCSGRGLQIAIPADNIPKVKEGEMAPIFRLWIPPNEEEDNSKD